MRSATDRAAIAEALPATMVWHVGHHSAGSEERTCLEPERGLVVQQALPPVLRYKLRQHHRDQVVRILAIHRVYVGKQGRHE